MKRRAAGGSRRRGEKSINDEEANSSSLLLEPNDGGSVERRDASAAVVPEVVRPLTPVTPVATALDIPVTLFLWLRDRRVPCDGVQQAAAAAGSATTATRLGSVVLPAPVVDRMIDGDALAPVVEACLPRGTLDYALPLNARKHPVDDRMRQRSPIQRSSHAVAAAAVAADREKRAHLRDVRTQRWSALKQSFETAAGGADAAALLVPSQCFDAVAEQRDGSALRAVLTGFHEAWKRRLRQEQHTVATAGTHPSPKPRSRLPPLPGIQTLASATSPPAVLSPTSDPANNGGGIGSSSSVAVAAVTTWATCATQTDPVRILSIEEDDDVTFGPGGTAHPAGEEGTPPGGDHLGAA